MGAAPVGPPGVGELDEVVGQQSWYPNLQISCEKDVQLAPLPFKGVFRKMYLE